MNNKSYQLDLVNAKDFQPARSEIIGNCAIVAADFDYLGSLWINASDGTISCRRSGEISPECVFNESFYVSFALDGELGVFGNGDGELYVVDVQTLCRLHSFRLPPENDIVSISINKSIHRIFVSSVYHIFIYSLQGDLLGTWDCKVQPYCMCYCNKPNMLWSGNDGIELIDLSRNESVVVDSNHSQCVTGIAKSCDGYIACFVNTIDIFTEEGNVTFSVSNPNLEFIDGRFVACRHVAVRSLELNASQLPAMRLTRCYFNGWTFDIFRSCSCLAISMNSNEVAVFRGNQLFTFTSIKA